MNCGSGNGHNVLEKKTGLIWTKVHVGKRWERLSYQMKPDLRGSWKSGSELLGKKRLKGSVWLAVSSVCTGGAERRDVHPGGQSPRQEHPPGHYTGKVSLKFIFKGETGAARVVQRFSTAFSPGCDPGDPGSSPTSGSLHGACFSLCLCLCLFLSVCLLWINK